MSVLLEAATFALIGATLMHVYWQWEIGKERDRFMDEHIEHVRQMSAEMDKVATMIKKATESRGDQ